MGFDLAENLLRLKLFNEGPDIAAQWIWATFVVSAAKWFMVIVIAAVFLECLRAPQPWVNLQDGVMRFGRILWRARLATAAVALFAGLVLLEPTGQVNDLLRQWFADFHSGVYTVLAACVLGIAAGRSVHELLLESYEEEEDLAADRWSGAVRFAIFLVGVVLAVLALRFQLYPLWGVVGILGFVLVLELLWLGPNGVIVSQALSDAQDSRREAASSASAEDGPAIHAYGLVLTLAPVLALMFSAVKAYTPAALVEPGVTIGVEVVVFVAGVFVVGTVFGLLFFALARPWWGAMSMVVLLLVVATLSVMTDQVAVPSLVVLTVMLTLFLAALTVAQRFSERWPVPEGLLVLGFSRVPFALLLVAMLGVCSAIADGSAHDTRRTADAPPQDGIPLVDAWKAWKTANCADVPQREPIPLVLVASQGGGQRAAYWTASTLTHLFGTRLGNTDDPDDCRRTPSEAVFALGGASGGSLGNTAWVSNLNRDTESPQDWYAKPFAESDPLSQPLAWMLSVDLARAYVGFRSPDRAAILEDGVARRVGGLNDDFFGDALGNGGSRPLLVLTGTQVETGCRISISTVRLNGTGQDQCDSLDRHDAAVTNDVLDYLCDENGASMGGLRRSTAALLSARFPYISPSGRMYRCSDKSPTAVVDGGYADNTGVEAILELWRDLEPEVAAHNNGSGAQVVPVFLMLDNHYRPLATPRAPDRVQELYVPPTTKDRPDALDDIAAEQRARAIFGSRFIAIRPEVSPGLQAPLAWSLSQMSINDLNRQRNKAVARHEVVTFKSWIGLDQP